ncbi:MAG TPA: hypothetical protein VHK91_13925 [Flavisolibacter sp.]|jgi:hypothetical protein|nr:hypothetical protein [Flavisolibacter sp.]
MTERNKETNKNNDINERGLKSKSSETPIYLNSDSTLQTPEEDQHDKNIDTRDDETLDVSNDDLHETKADRMAGSDRAGTSERKDNSLSEES